MRMICIFLYNQYMYQQTKMGWHNFVIYFPFPYDCCIIQMLVWVKTYKLPANSFASVKSSKPPHTLQLHYKMSHTLSLHFPFLSFQVLRIEHQYGIVTASYIYVIQLLKTFRRILSMCLRFYTPTNLKNYIFLIQKYVAHVTFTLHLYIMC